MWTIAGPVAAGGVLALAHYLWAFTSIWATADSDQGDAVPAWLNGAMIGVGVGAPGVLGIAAAAFVAQGDLVSGIIAPIVGGVVAIVVLLLLADRAFSAGASLAGQLTAFALPLALSFATMIGARYLV